MTREEAIKIIEVVFKDKDTYKYYDSVTHQALNMAIEALKEVQKHEETFEWCTDCKEYDKDNYCCHRWSKMIRNTVEELKEYSGLVRCKDCKWHKLTDNNETEVCTNKQWDISMAVYPIISADDFCSYGERKEP